MVHWSNVKRCMRRLSNRKEDLCKNVQDIWYSIGKDGLKAQHLTCLIYSKLYSKLVLVQGGVTGYSMQWRYTGDRDSIDELHAKKVI